MADSTCLINGFSYASAISNEPKQGNPIHVLGESISFGRFVNESLSWERWSTFSSPHKKYVEEAQRYAQPGSVAQKKVFFEAHYKKIAAQKAAAAAALVGHERPGAVASSGSSVGVGVKSSEVAVAEVVADKGRSIAIVGEDEPLKESPVMNDSIGKCENLDSISVSESSGTTTTTSQIERPLLKHQGSAAKGGDEEEDDATSAPSKRRTSFSSLRSSIQRKTWRAPPSTAVDEDKKQSIPAGGDDKPLQQENESIGLSRAKNHYKKKTDSISVSKSSGTTTSQTERPLLKSSAAKAEDDDATSAPSRTRPSFSALRSSIQRRTWRAPPSTPVVNPAAAAAHKKRENSSLTQQALNLGVLVDFNKQPTASLGSLIDLISTKEPDKEETQSSSGLLLRSSYRVPDDKDRPTPLRTPLEGDKISSAATPQTANNKRMQTPTDSSALGGKTAGPRRHIFSAIYSKSLSACRSKLQSPALLSSPFVLRTEERAAKRKQKLEEKFNAGEAQRVQHQQQQKTLKDKAGAEIRKLGCGFCFKARPLPEFYKEREPPKSHDLKKIDATQSQPPAPAKGTTANKRKGTASMPQPLPPPPPPPSASAKNTAAAAAASKTTATSAANYYTLGERIARENQSPNIQL